MAVEASPFVWGRAGAKLTPAELARLREAEAVRAQGGIDTSPVGHWTQGLARVAEAAAGAFRRGRLDRQQKENDTFNAAESGALSEYFTRGLTGGGTQPAALPASDVSAEMSSSSPASAQGSGALPSSFLSAVDSTEGAGAYDTLYGHAQRNGPFAGTDISKMTVGEAMAFADPSGPYAQHVKGQIGRVATPMGRHQIVGTTLKNAVGELGIDPSTPFDANTQDTIAAHLARRRLASADTLDGKISALRSEWHGFNNVPRDQMAQIIADLENGGGMPQQAAPVEVASLDQSIGMPGAGQEMAATQPGYVDPRLAAPNAAQMPAMAAPALPEGRDVAALPVPPGAAPLTPETAQAAPPPQQMAQAMPEQGNAEILARAVRAMRDPQANEATKRVANAVIQQEMERQKLMQQRQWELEDRNQDWQREDARDQRDFGFQREKFDYEREQWEKANRIEQEKLAWDREKFDREVSKGQWQKLTDGRLYNETTGEFKDAPPPVAGSTSMKFDDVSSLRKEIQQLPSYKNVAQALPIYRAMAETAGRNSKASDLNLVYGLGKIMDPTSVVREGEMVMVKNTASLPDWFQGAIASLNGGAALTPETRAAIMNEAYGRIKGYDDAFKMDTQMYSGIVERNRMNPADVLPNFGSFDAWKPPEDISKIARPDNVPEDLWSAMEDEEKRLWLKN